MIDFSKKFKSSFYKDVLYFCSILREKKLMILNEKI